MPRRRRFEKHPAAPDPIYASVALGKFVNCIMLNGKKSLAQNIVYDAFEHIRRASKKEPIEVFEAAMKNATPQIEVKPRRVGGATYQVPVEIRYDRRDSLARRWIINAARARRGHSMAEKLSAELLDAANGLGAAIKRRDDTHRMAESNKAFSHFRY